MAEAAGKDPIEFRLALLERAMKNPVGEKNDYEADRYAGVLQLVRTKSNWGEELKGVYRGVSAYFCHDMEPPINIISTSIVLYAMVKPQKPLTCILCKMKLILRVWVNRHFHR